MGVPTWLAISAVSSALGAGASAYGAYDAHETTKKQIKRAEQKESDVFETEKKKQKRISDNYAGMQSNLYSGGVEGVNTNNLVQ
jgi:hypothetical protein